MATNSACDLAELSGAVEAYAHSLNTAYIYLMVSTVLGTLLTPLLLVLLSCSTLPQWRSPMFLCVVVSVVLALLQCLNQVFLEFKVLNNPLSASTFFTTPVVTLTTLLIDLPSLVANLALMCRMLTVYPLSTTPRAKFVAIFAPVVAFKLLRIASVTIFLIDLTRGSVDPMDVNWSAQERVWGIVDRVVSALDNGYATAFFLWKLRPAIHLAQDLGRVSAGDSSSLCSRIESLFWFSTTNFLLPVLLYIVQVAFAIAYSNTITYAILMFFTNFVAVVCVALATVWCSSSSSFRGSVKGFDRSLQRQSTVLFRPTLHQPGVYSGPFGRDVPRLTRNAQIRGEKKTSMTRDEELVEKVQYSACGEALLDVRADASPCGIDTRRSARCVTALFRIKSALMPRFVLKFKVLYNPLLAVSILTKPVVALTTLLDVLPNYFADLALLCRMLAVYSSPLTSKPRFYVLFGTTVVFKVLRVISISLFLIYVGRVPVHAVTFKWTSQERMWSLVDRCVTAVDNAYATAFFLWKIQPAVRSNPEYGRYTAGERGSFGSRLRSLFWFSVTNFVLPVPLYAVRVVLAITNTHSLTYGVMLFFASFTSVICVAFATIWCSSTFQTIKGHGVSALSVGAAVTSLHFAPDPGASVDNDSTSDRRTRVLEDRTVGPSRLAKPL